MRKVFLGLLFLCNLKAAAQSKNDLSSAFVSSIQQNNYTILQKFIPSYNQLKQISPKEFTEAKAKLFIANLKASWSKIKKVAATKKVNLSSIKIIETNVNVFDEIKNMSFLSIHYLFNKNDEGLTQLLVTQLNQKWFLLNIPNPTMMFTSKDPQKIKDELMLLKSTNDINLEKTIQQQVDSLKIWVTTNNKNAFLQKCVYRGNDEIRKWKTPVDVNNIEEVEAATSTYYKAKNILENCATTVNSTLKLEKESEGLWHVYTFICNDKKVHFAFLKINDNYCLGDIDLE